MNKRNLTWIIVLAILLVLFVVFFLIPAPQGEIKLATSAKYFEIQMMSNS